jgi:EmrB/QacA subfamily drug resistance transporter
MSAHQHAPGAPGPTARVAEPDTPAAGAPAGHSAPGHHDRDDDARFDRRSRLALTLLCVAQAMLVLDITVMNVALPQIGFDIGLVGSAAGWAVAAYAVPFGGLLLLGGRLADLLGSRRMVLIGLAVFTAASITTGLADGSAAFLAGRVGQGIGAALLSPAAMSTVLHLFHGALRTRALAVWAAIGGSGAAVGVLLGGLLVGGPGWRWIFFINIPIGIAVAALLPMVVPAVPGRGAARVDALGAVLATAGVAGLVTAVSADVSTGTAWVVAAAALVVLGLFVVVERRTEDPLVDLRVFARPAIQAGTTLMLVATVLLVGGFFLLSFRLQAGLGWSATTTGLAFLPVALGTIVGAHLAGRLLPRFGPRAVAPAGLLVAGAGLGVAAAGTDVAALLVATMTVVAVGLGGALVSATTTALATAGHAEAGVLSGLVTSFHEVGAGFGAAIFSAVAASSLVAGGPTDGFVRAYALATGIALVGAALARHVVPAGRPTGGQRFLH